jgi:hypothetical protein
MGKLYYGGTREPILIPDRLLAHLKVVIATKLRRNESLTLTFRAAQPEGRTTIWLQPSIELRFVFGSAEPELLDSDMLKKFANEAASSAGLTVDLLEAAVEEPAPTA